MAVNRHRRIMLDPDSKAGFSTNETSLIHSVQTGKISFLGEKKVRTGFLKTPVSGPVLVDWLGLEGDVQADKRVHGGLDKAVYAYLFDHYESWLPDLPQNAAILQPGGFGENLTLTGPDEREVCIGDIFQIGSTLLQVSQPRQPCSKLTLRFKSRQIAKMMFKNGRCGWYYRVLERGKLEAGDRAILQQRLNPAWPVLRFQNLIAAKSKPLEDMREAAEMAGLAPEWKEKARVFLAKK